MTSSNIVEPAHGSPKLEYSTVIRPRILTRAPTDRTISAAPQCSAAGRLGPSPISNSGWPTEQPFQQAGGQSPTGVSPSSADGRSRASSFHWEDDGVRIYTALDGGYTAAEKTYNSNGTGGDTGTNQDAPLGPLLYDSCYEIDHIRKFLPIDKLFELVNHNSVRRELSRALASSRPSEEELDRYTSAFCSHIEYADPNIADRKLKSSRQCIFATLAILCYVDAAPAFARSEILDKDLPLEKKGNEFVGRDDNRSPPKRMPIPQDWDYLKINHFHRCQYYTISPFFDLGSKNDVPFHELGEHHVLPFVENYYMQRRQHGYHGTVWRVKIHRAHHNFYNEDDGNPYFAVKELTSSDNEGLDFKKEVTAWARSVGVAGHKHIIRLLATWHMNNSNSWYLLFGWADGNLRDYWENNEPGNQQAEPGRSHELAQWVGEQCLGIAQGLAKIHRSSSNDDDQTIQNFGIHGDIKPENILRFEDKHLQHGRLVICDFGFTRFHSKKSRSAAHAEGISKTYRAPEYDAVGREQNGISRAYDVWSLGCVYLEFITWYLEGFQAVAETFPGDRTREDRGEPVRTDKFFICVTLDGTDTFGAVVKPCVRQWIRNLRSLEHCSQFCHDFLDMIEHHLLVPDPKARSDCHALTKKLAAIYRKACDTESGRRYCLEGCSRDMVESPTGFMRFEYPEDEIKRMKSSSLPVPTMTREGMLIMSEDSNQPWEDIRSFSPRPHNSNMGYALSRPQSLKPSTIGQATPQTSRDGAEDNSRATKEAPLLPSGDSQGRDLELPEPALADPWTSGEVTPRASRDDMGSDLAVAEETRPVQKRDFPEQATQKVCTLDQCAAEETHFPLPRDSPEPRSRNSAEVDPAFGEEINPLSHCNSEEQASRESTEFGRITERTPLLPGRGSPEQVNSDRETRRETTLEDIPAPVLGSPRASTPPVGTETPDLPERYPIRWIDYWCCCLRSR